MRHPNHITNPEAISLNSPRQKTFPHHHHHRKSDREVLYQSNEDTPAVTPTADIDGTIGNMAIVMEDPVANIAPQDHDEVQMQFDWTRINLNKLLWARINHFEQEVEEVGTNC